MNFPPQNVAPFHNQILDNTLLGRLCRKQKLFRDRYKILKMLGRGGFGITFLAEDVSLPGHPQCVIKQLCPQVNQPTALKNAQKRFEREAKTLSILGQHPQIPRLLENFEIDGDFFLVQEYIPGMTLARWIRSNGCLKEDQIKQVLCQILPILEYIHDKKVIHRDIKPQNIIRHKHGGGLVLIDFGAVKEELAKIRTMSEYHQSSTSHFIGTIGFAPPEQFSLRPVFATDIYSLGVTCLYLLTGKAPLDFESDIRTGKLQWKETVNNIHESLSNILDKMIQPALENRYKTASDVLRDLGQNTMHDHLYSCINEQDPKIIEEEKPPYQDREGPYYIREARKTRIWNTRREEREMRELFKEQFQKKMNETDKKKKF